MNKDSKNALESLDKAGKYLRELIPHDAPSSARKVCILSLFTTIRQALKQPAPDVISRSDFVRVLSFRPRINADDAECVYDFLKRTYPKGVIIKGDR